MITPANFPKPRFFVRELAEMPVPPIASRMARGVEAQTAMKLYLSAFSHTSKRLPESRRETLKPL